MTNNALNLNGLPLRVTSLHRSGFEATKAKQFAFA